MMGIELFKDEMYRRFAVERPIATMCQLTLRRLLDRDSLDQIFRDHAQTQYEQTLLFSTTA